MKHLLYLSENQLLSELENLKKEKRKIKSELLLVEDKISDIKFCLLKFDEERKKMKFAGVYEETDKK